MKYGTKEAKENIFVVHKLQKALLGRPGIESLNLIARIEDEKFVKMYPKLFKGLGTIAGEYCISLQEGACNLDPQKNTITSYAKSQTGA